LNDCAKFKGAYFDFTESGRQEKQIAEDIYSAHLEDNLQRRRWLVCLESFNSLFLSAEHLDDSKAQAG